MNKKNNTLVTIGIPFYNAEKFLHQAISSVINQTYANWELILIDDGSIDASLNLARLFSDERITIISDGENKGLVFRLNQLTSIAKGDFYARMDADDIMHIDRIKIQVDYLNKHPEVDVVGTSYYSIDVNNKLKGKTEVNLKPDSVKSILKSGCFAHPSIMGRTEWFKNNPYDEKWIRMEDIELWIRTVHSSNFKNLSEPLLFYRNIGVPTLRKYIKSNTGIVKLLQNRTEYKINIMDSIYYSFVYWLKNFIYIIFFSFGQMGRLIEMRSKKMSTNEAINATADLLNSIK